MAMYCITKYILKPHPLYLFGSVRLRLNTHTTSCFRLRSRKWRTRCWKQPLWWSESLSLTRFIMNLLVSSLSPNQSLTMEVLQF